MRAGCTDGASNTMRLEYLLPVFRSIIPESQSLENLLVRGKVGPANREARMSKAATLLYAAIAYAIFFATFLYLIAFVGDVPLVPRTVDQGPEAPIAVALIINTLLIAVFGLQHSIMARQGFKRAWTRIVPPQAERSTFVLFASLALIMMFVFWRPIGTGVWEVSAPPAQMVLWALFGLGWLVVLLSTFLINHFELFGLQQAYLHARGYSHPNRCPLRTQSGLHPRRKLRAAAIKVSQAGSCSSST